MVTNACHYVVSHIAALSCVQVCDSEAPLVSCRVFSLGTSVKTPALPEVNRGTCRYKCAWRSKKTRKKPWRSLSIDRPPGPVRKMIYKMNPPCSDGRVDPHPKGGSSHQVNNSPARPIRVVLLSTTLDCESLAAQFTLRRRIELVESSPDLDFGLERCRQLRPHLLIIDPKINCQAVELAIATARSGTVGHVIVLDDRIHEGVVARLLATPSVSYITRQAGMNSLYEAVVKGATTSERVFDPAISHRVRRTSRGLRLEQLSDRPSVAALTTREREVMQLLALGIRFATVLNR